MMDNKVKIFSDPYKTTSNFAEYFLELVKNNTTFNVALSGGSTPILLFDSLAANHSQSKIWQKINFYWGDERCVAADDKDSNYGMTKRHLLDKMDIPAENIYRIKGENDPQTEVQRYSSLLIKNLSVKNSLPVFDLIILGMGDDGHTASIFPNQMDLINSKKACAIAEHPASKQKRITLTGRTINNAKEVSFLVTGDNKKRKVFEILNKSAEWKKYPASYINPDTGKLLWFLDKAAASLLY